MTEKSSKWRPVIIIPIGSPFSVKPQGIECEGCPVVSNTPVNHASSFPPVGLPGAGLHSAMVGVAIGTDGVIRTSTPFIDSAI